jgi:hypothetical protein
LAKRGKITTNGVKPITDTYLVKNPYFYHLPDFDPRTRISGIREIRAQGKLRGSLAYLKSNLSHLFFQLQNLKTGIKSKIGIFPNGSGGSKGMIPGWKSFTLI